MLHEKKLSPRPGNARNILNSRNIYKKIANKNGRFTIMIRGRASQQEIDAAVKRAEHGDSDNSLS